MSVCLYMYIHTYLTFLMRALQVLWFYISSPCIYYNLCIKVCVHVQWLHMCSVWMRKIGTDNMIV